MPNIPPMQLATKEFPIRASLLPTLFQCPKLFWERTLADGEDRDSNEPADTGSLAHLGIQAFHTLGGMKAVAPAIKGGKDKFPQGDPDKAFSFVSKYIEREKADPKGKIIKTEWQASITLPPAPFDPTGQEIVIFGTIDQIREFGKKEPLWVVDHKSGMTPGPSMVNKYTPQQAAYMLIAHRHFNRPVKGFITRIQDLYRRDQPFWWELPFGPEHCEAILQPVRTRIALLRMGLQDATGGKHCDYCPQLTYPGCVSGTELHDGRQLKPRQTLTTVDELFAKG